MAFQVVDGDERHAPDGGNGLGCHHADQHATDQPWAAGGGNGVEIAETDPGLIHRPVDDAVDQLQMRARRDLGHDAAERPVIFDLRQHLVGQNSPVAVDHGGGGFIATGFDAQDDH